MVYSSKTGECSTAELFWHRKRQWTPTVMKFCVPSLSAIVLSIHIFMYFFVDGLETRYPEGRMCEKSRAR